MKKIFRNLLVVLATAAACFGFVFALASCSGSKVSKAYADNINNAASNNNHVTYETAKNDLGKECNDWTMGGTGFMFAVKGYDNIENEEAFNRLVLGGDEKTKYEAIFIVCTLGKCTSATFVEGTGEQVSQALANAITL